MSNPMTRSYHRPFARLTLAAFLSTVAVATPERAFAQSDEQRAGARALAGDGAKAYAEGRWKDCVDLFTRAESLVHAPPHLLYLARAEAKQGHLVRAREAYLRIAREQLPDSAPPAFRNAQAAAAEEIKPIEPRIGSLTVQLTGGDPSAVTVTLDGVTVPAALVGVSRPADPGDHRIEAKGTGFVADPVNVHIADGGRESVTLALKATPSDAPVALPGRGIEAVDVSANTQQDSDDKSKDTLRIASYAAAGVGVLGLIGGTVFALKSKSKRSDADSLYEKGCSAGCDASDPAAKQVSSLDDSARSAKTLSIVSFVVGGVGLAAGGTLFFLSNKHKETPQAAFSIQPVIGFGSAGVVGRF
jgi:hypothetical protein